MNERFITPEEHYAAIVEALLGEPGVDPPQAGRGFGSAELKIHNKIFAMLSSGKLVVKLPRARVDALIDSGDGERFDPRKNGQLMKEWLVVAPMSQMEWLPLAREAMEFVGSKR